MLNSNDPIKVVHLQKLANQSILHDALVIEMVNNFFNESKNNLTIETLKQGMKYVPN